MMHIEVLIRCSQPPSRRLSDSLPTFANSPEEPGNAPPNGYAAAGRESRDTVSVRERVFLHNCLSKPVLGVTLVHHADLPPIERNLAAKRNLLELE